MKHHWTGWPGAICYHCGSEDPVEIALADGIFDGDTWLSEERKQECIRLDQCPIEYSENCPQCQNQ